MKGDEYVARIKCNSVMKQKKQYRWQAEGGVRWDQGCPPRAAAAQVGKGYCCSHILWWHLCSKGEDVMCLVCVC